MKDCKLRTREQREKRGKMKNEATRYNLTEEVANDALERVGELAAELAAAAKNTGVENDLLELIERLVHEIDADSAFLGTLRGGSDADSGEDISRSNGNQQSKNSKAHFFLFLWGRRKSHKVKRVFWVRLSKKAKNKSSFARSRSCALSIACLPCSKTTH